MRIIWVSPPKYPVMPVPMRDYSGIPCQHSLLASDARSTVFREGMRSVAGTSPAHSRKQGHLDLRAPVNRDNSSCIRGRLIL